MECGLDVIQLRRITLLTVFTALGVALSPITWFQFLTTKAYPTQHLINALTGVILGPWWGMLTALLIGIIRNMIGVGTLYAFPGGVPGALIVGLAYMITSRLRNRFLRYSAALMEPIGTVLIGGTISVFILAPAIGDVRILGVIEQRGALEFLPIFWLGWALSSVPGSILGYMILLALDRSGVLDRVRVYGVKPGIQARRRGRS
ncbi:MAG: energy coupling factor transporter S component ThiW [Thaumarchaeota archaeon]|nr:MAG: energy coupling factor transporter S component ThiW [Nitrososphaerota archaeon]